MAEHFHLLASIKYLGCLKSELPYVQQKIKEIIKQYSQHAYIDTKQGVDNIFNDKIECNFFPYDARSVQAYDNHPVDVDYSYIIVTLSGNNYNMSEEYWRCFFKYLLNDSNFSIHSLVVQLQFDCKKTIYITQNGLEESPKITEY